MSTALIECDASKGNADITPMPFAANAIAAATHIQLIYSSDCSSLVHQLLDLMHNLHQCTTRIDLFLQHACIEVESVTYFESVAWVQDEDSGIFARPSFTGNTPAAANFYSEIEWREEFLGDVVFNKPPQIMVSCSAHFTTQMSAHTVQH